MKKTIIPMVFVAAIFVSCQKMDDDPVKGLIERKDITLTRSQLDFVKSNTGFALDFFKIASDKEGDKNMLVSPISVTFALGMVNNGAKNETQKEINEVLGYKGDSIDDLNSFCKTMLEQGAEIDPSTTIEIANMAVINKAFIPLKDAFTKTVQSNYEANVLYKDFAKDDVKTIINKWCEEKTHGMIKDFLPQPVNPREYAHFLNATYFKGIWSSQFKKSDSKKEKFTTLDGKEIKVNMMHQKAKFNYGGIGGLCSAVCLPYGNQAYRMILLLPDENISLGDLKKELTPDSWQELNSMFGFEVDVKIPSFESVFGTQSVKSVLEEMGITRAFDPYYADFSGITDEWIYISDVMQQAKIKVDEQGSEAAAVTDIVAMSGVAGPTPSQLPVFEFHADRPFLYAITEVSTGAIYFMGQYTGVE